jgi:hypothetical protein
MGWDGIRTNKTFKDVFEEEYYQAISSKKIIEYAEIVESNHESTFYVACKRTNGAIGANVILFSRNGGEVLWKEMDEGMGPYGYDCPERILKLLSPLSQIEYVGYSEEWRKKQKHAPKTITEPTKQVSLF